MRTDKKVINIGKQDFGGFANALDCEPFYSLKEIIEAKSTKRLKEMHNHTHIWFNKGHTPDEIFKLYRPKTSEPHSATKVGRNDPCPCGSGKKYKKCCGLLS